MHVFSSSEETNSKKRGILTDVLYPQDVKHQADTTHPAETSLMGAAAPESPLAIPPHDKL